MNLLESLRHEMASAVAEEKAYTVPSVCAELGLGEGEESEAWKSKYYYVDRRLKALSKDRLLQVGKQVLERYGTYQLEELLELMKPSTEGTISAITRRNLIDEIERLGNTAGNLDLAEFLNRIFPLAQMPGADQGLYHRTLQDSVYQHMVRNPEDWSYKNFFEFAQYSRLSERRFRLIVEQIVHPEVRTGAEQQRYVACFNEHLMRDGLQLAAVDQTSGYLVYKVVRRGGVAGTGKNLIFAANGPKPRIVLVDAVNNDIRIVKNGEHCLIYDRPIGLEGLRWADLVTWWQQSDSSSEAPERALYKRLFASLASKPEQRFFRLYFESLRNELKEELPAILPQVYLHYDPYTLRELPDGSDLVRQRMDFLLLLPYRQRIVIEIDGQQHYSEKDKPSPSLYAKMVAEDRNLRLQGYEVYRFGGFELTGENAKSVVDAFLKRLLRKAP